jgi:AcrR family transcriptional regulator
MSIAPMTRKRGVELEGAIRDAVVAELIECGYGAMSIESVAARARTGKASIYRRWSTKQDLVLDSFSCLMAGPLLVLLEQQLDDTISTRDALVHVASQIASLISGPGAEAMRSIIGESLRDEEFSATFESHFFKPRKDALLNLLRRGVIRGEVRADAVNDFVPEMLAGVMMHRLLLRRRSLSPQDAEELIDRLVIPAISPRARSAD